jgi:hypothetical protein
MIALSDILRPDDRRRTGTDHLVRELVLGTEAPTWDLSAIPERVDDFSGWDRPARRSVLTGP